MSRLSRAAARCLTFAAFATLASAALPPTRSVQAALPVNLAVVPATCQPSQLTLSTTGSNSGAGHVGIDFRFHNRSARTCTLYGYPGALMLDARGQALPTFVIRGYGYLAGAHGPHTVHLVPGGNAYTLLEYVHFPSPGQRCYTSASLLVTPPNDYSAIRLPLALMDVCGGRLRAAPVAAVPYF